MTEIAVTVESLSKVYKLYSTPKARLKEALHPLRKKFHRNFHALRNVSFQIEKGQVFGIIGRNGSGKSTLLKIICSVIQPTSGLVKTNGSISALLELGAGFNPEYTGMENIYFLGSIMGLSRHEMERKIDGVISFAEIGEYIDQPLKTYSSGMKARLAFALATKIDPEILVVDEVLSVGDELFQRKSFARMEEFMAQGKTIIFVSHSVGTINEICTRCILMDKGELILEGAPKLVTTQYQKLIYSNPEKAQSVRDTIVLLNRKRDVIAEAEITASKDSEKLDSLAGKPAEIEMKNDLFFQKPVQKPFYIEAFQPKSTVEYKNRDVIITDIQIKTPDGDKVNALVMNDEYLYSYVITFNIPAENVVISVAIKNEKGLNISSANTGDSAILKRVERKISILVQWYFTCTLLPGTYYTNIGVTRFLSGGDFEILNRIVDATVFKVQPIERLPYRGLVHFNQKPVLKLMELK